MTADPDPSARHERALRHLSVLGALARLGSENLTAPRFFQRVCEEVSRAVEIEHVKLMRYRADKADLFCEAGVGWRPGVVGAFAFGSDFGAPTGRAYRTAQPVVVDDLAASEFRSNRVLDEHGVVSLINVPVVIDGTAWGVLEVDSSVPRRFEDDTVEFLTSAAALVGLFVRKRQAEAEHAAVLAASVERTRSRELALREMQHRVKNNFQTILAVIAMQRQRFPTDQGRALIDLIVERIMAVSLAHDQLSPTREGEVVDLPSYLSALTTAIERPAETVVVDVRCDPLSVSIEQAVPIGLLVNECVTNSLKYAFGPQGGTVRVTLDVEADGWVRLVVADDGRGFAPDRRPGTGTRLLSALTAQLRGEIRQRAGEPGAVTEIRFPRPVEPDGPGG